MRLRTFVTPLIIAALAISLTGCGAGSNATTRLTKK
jgi:predicted small lipoprotein YifL